MCYQYRYTDSSQENYIPRTCQHNLANYKKEVNYGINP